MSRSGLNTTLTYSYNKVTYAFSVRVQEIAFGSHMVAEESQARTRRAYYPHTVASVPFSIVPILKGSQERTQFSNYLNDYIRRCQDPKTAISAFPTIKVTCSVRNFLRWGVPTSGIEWGDHISAMVWTPRVVFETHVDQSLAETTNSWQWISYYQLDKSSIDKSPQIKYFYPSGIQLSGDGVPNAAAYDQVQSLSSQDLTNIINGGTSGGSDPGGDPSGGSGSGSVSPPFMPGQGMPFTPNGPVGG